MKNDDSYRETNASVRLVLPPNVRYVPSSLTGPACLEVPVRPFTGPVLSPEATDVLKRSGIPAWMAEGVREEAGMLIARATVLGMLSRGMEPDAGPSDAD